MKIIFGGLVRLFPAAFRRQFGAEVAEQAIGEYRRARGLGMGRAMQSFLGSAFNIVAAACAERVRPTWHDPNLPPRKRPDMSTLVDPWRLDLTYALRALRRSPGFTVVTVLTLAIAIGVTAGIFSIVNTVLIQPLPYAHPDRLVFVAGTAPGSDLPEEFGLANEFYVHYRDRARTIEDLALVQSFTSTLRVGDEVERVRMSAAPFTLFSTLGVAPVLGALPTAAIADESAVISYTLWQTWFGGATDVIGQRHSMGGTDRTIVGVMGPDFRFPVEGTLLWLTNDVRPEGIVPGRFGLGMVARLAPGVTMADAERELTNLARELPDRFGGSAAYARFAGQFRAILRPAADQMLGPAARSLWVLLAAAGIVLLIACANVANLFLVRAEGRQREMALRRAVGAGRGQLLRVQMAEVLLVALAAGGVAVLLTRLSLPALLRVAPAGVPRLGDAVVDGTTLAVTGALAMLAAVLCGVLPAFRAAHPSFARLRDGSRGSTRGRMWVRNGLVAGQTALALVLLIGSGLLLRSHAKLSAVDPGYDTDGIFTFQIAPEQPTLTDGPSYARFIMDFTDRLRTLAGVESVGVIENMPLDEGTAGARFLSDAIPADSPLLVSNTFAGEDYFQTMGISVLAGRGFTRADATTSLGHAVLSRSAARMLFPGVDPIGRRIQRVGIPTWETVVGVVEDTMQEDLRQPAQALVYFPLTGQQPTLWRLSSPAYVIKTARADTIAADVRGIVRQIAPEAPMYRVYTMAGLVERELLGLSFTMLTLGVVSALALVLGAVGLYGVLSYVVTERTREIGVRMALGAQAGTVRRMVVAQGSRVIGAGIVVGLGVALLVTQALGSLLYGVEAVDPATFAVTAGVMASIGLAASYLPARRASNVDPIESLRGE